jgi:hypothetical protein
MRRQATVGFRAIAATRFLECPRWTLARLSASASRIAVKRGREGMSTFALKSAVGGNEEAAGKALAVATNRAQVHSRA